MKKYFLYSMVLCAAILMGCDKDKNKEDDNTNENGVIDGRIGDGIIIENEPDVNITGADEELPSENTTDKSGKSTLGLKASNDYGLKANDYRFKLVAEMSTLKLSTGDVVQATDVKITDTHAFVAYNTQGEAHKGGAVVYEYTVSDGSFETATVTVTPVASVQLPKAELSAIEFYNNKLYMIGASEEPKFGYNEERDGYNYAFLLVMELDANKKFKTDATPKIVPLSSFQGTSIRVNDNNIFITTGDGANGTKGGLYILKTSDYSKVNFVEKDHARSVTIDGSNVYMMSAEPARVFKYDMAGNNEVKIYPPDYSDLNYIDDEDEDNSSLYQYKNEAMQKEARSDMYFWNNYLFVSMNESGLRMVKSGGEFDVMQAIERPGDDANLHVTNSVFMNADPKKDATGNLIPSNLLLLANGEKGVYWYDVMKDSYDKDRIVASEANSVLAASGKSANFISSKGNVVFVANGLGGLKVLYIGFEEAEPEPACANENAFSGYETFIKDNGNSKLDPPLDRKVGEVGFEIVGDNLVITLWETVPNKVQLKQSGVLFGPSLEYFDGLGIMKGGPALKDKNIGNGDMKDQNAEYRTLYSDGTAKFVFPKDYVISQRDENGDLLIIIYGGNGTWAYGIPQGPSGSTGTGVTNNGQIIKLEGVFFCDE